MKSKSIIQISIFTVGLLFGPVCTFADSSIETRSPDSLNNQVANIATTSVPARIKDIDVATDIETSASGNAKENSTAVRDSTIGCAAGATLGSVLPGLGNAIGCVVGGLIGFFTS